MKTCTGCGATKPLDQFPLARKGKFGRGAKCSRCTALWRAEHRDYMKAYNAAYYADNSEKIKEQVKVYAKANGYAAQRKRDPDRLRAAQKVQKALQRGHLQKLPCFCCGQEAEAHHPDYSDPLGVVWLCRNHHQEIHNGR